MEKIIVCDTDACTGCRICEYACSVANYGKINPRASRIKTLRVDPTFDIALSCRKCKNPKCINVCARNAITQDQKLQIKIDKTKCDGCGYCVDACTFGVLTMGLDTKVTLVCDNCAESNNGNPVCVDYCPKGALKYQTLDEIESEKTKKLHKKLQEKADV